MPVESSADLAAFFNVDEFAKQAIYAPPGSGDPVACTVLLDSADRDLDFGQGAPVLQGFQLEVRVAEVAAPERGGTFTIGALVLTVIEDPQARDPDRLIWTMRVR